MAWHIALTVAGLVFLFLGGEGLVRGSVAIADRFMISKAIVGMVIVGFGTSTPELLVSVDAALAGVPDISIGNVVGSNIANILLIMGLAALIAPMANTDKTIRRDAVLMTAISAALLPFLFQGELARWHGVVLLIALFLYLLYSLRLAQQQRVSAYSGEVEVVEDIPLSTPTAVLVAIAGLALLVSGAHLLVEGATSLARTFGVSEAVIGLTIVAVGTSLPELATSVMAALRRQSEVALANVIGSNIFNILAILGLTAIIVPVPVARGFITFDAPLMVLIAGLMLVVVIATATIGRSIGIVFLTIYAAYLVAQGIQS